MESKDGKPYFISPKQLWVGDQSEVNFDDNPLCPDDGTKTVITQHRHLDMDWQERPREYKCPTCGKEFDDEMITGTDSEGRAILDTLPAIRHPWHNPSS